MQDRRTFFRHTATLAAGLGTGMAFKNIGPVAEPEGLYMIGPRKGYSPRVGTLLSTMTMMRAWVVRQVESLSMEQLDWQFDDDSNSIGAMLLHLAATERYYQLNTFDEMEWGTWSQEIKDEWDIPMDLGEKGREHIKGHEINYYLDKLSEVRSITEKEFAERDDDWLMKSEPFFGDEPTNNHCKWFHVCEHESNHNGQIKFLMKRMPM